MTTQGPEQKPSPEQKTPYPVAMMVPLFVILMFGLPMAVAALPFLLVSALAAKLMAAIAMPFLFTFAFIGISALLSLPFQKAIIPGKFPRDIKHVVYGPRRLYGLCWCAVFYFTPLYYAAMSVPSLRKLLLYSFGYRGHPDVALAPDAWIRDLPLMRFGEGAYAANKCTIGTNICLADGNILVGPVSVGARSMIGHLTMLAPGTNIADRVEVGVGCGIGIRVKIGNKSRIGPTTTLNHGVEIGENVDIGTMSYLGIKARIGDGLKIPSGSCIPEGAELLKREDVANHRKVETQQLERELERVSRIYASRMGAATHLDSGDESKVLHFNKVGDV